MPLTDADILCLDTNLFLTADLQEYYIHAPTVDDDESKSEYYTLKDQLRNNPKEFFENMHMNANVFEYILDAGILAEKDLIITIRYLASGLSVTQIARRFYINKDLCYEIIINTIQNIWKSFNNIHLRPPTPEEMTHSAEKFYQRWKFPNCVGAIGCKYVALAKYNREKLHWSKTYKHTLILNVVADHDFRFVAVTTCNTDYNPSSFDDIFEDSTLQQLPGSKISLPLLVIGNASYALRPHLMKPYRGRNLTMDQTIFNKKLEKARIPMMGALEILTEKWQIFSNPISVKVQDASLLIKTACLLYNIVKDIDGMTDVHFISFGKVDKDPIQLHLVERVVRGDYRASFRAHTVRDLLSDYFKKKLFCIR